MKTKSGRSTSSAAMQSLTRSAGASSATAQSDTSCICSWCSTRSMRRCATSASSRARMQSAKRRLASTLSAAPAAGARMHVCTKAALARYVIEPTGTQLAMTVPLVGFSRPASSCSMSRSPRLPQADTTAVRRPPRTTPVAFSTRMRSPLSRLTPSKATARSDAPKCSVVAAEAIARYFLSLTVCFVPSTLFCFRHRNNSTTHGVVRRRQPSTKR